jgi:uncharacterized circularly permuted ATP-grasp superfamily protein
VQERPIERQALTHRGGGRLSAYTPCDSHDEAFSESGSPRSDYVRLIAELGDVDLGGLHDCVNEGARAAGVVFGGDGSTRDFRIDPIPRLIAAAEWDELELGLAQRVRALDAFCEDMHAQQAIVEAGLVPREACAGVDFIERELFHLGLPGPWISIAGLDIVRDGDGRLRVLEDNLRTPSGIAYALAARTLTDRWLPTAAARGGDLAHETRRLFAHVLAAPPPQSDPGEEGARVLLCDGPSNSAWYEQVRLAELLELPLVRCEDLRRRGERLELAAGGQPVHVVYRRTDEDRARYPDGSMTRVGELLLEPLRAGRVRLVNRFGTGIADDKLIYPHVEAMIGFYLQEQPLLHSVRTFDLGDPEAREQALARIGELVVKPRDGHGGAGVLIGPHASPRELRAAEAQILAEPQRWLAQELIELSTHPTVVDGRLQPRHVDLRPFAFYDGERVQLLPGGLTRVALREGSLVVNSSRQGGGKDTRVLV